MKRKIFSIFFALVLALNLSLVMAVPVGAAAATFVLNGSTFNSGYGPDQGYVAYIQPYDAENQFHSLPDQAIEQYGNPGDAPLGPWSQGDWFNFGYAKPFGGGETKAWAGQNYVVTYWWDRSVGDYVPINGPGGDIYIYQPEDGVRPMGILYQGVWRMFDAGTNGLSGVRGEEFWWDLSDAGVTEGDTIDALAWWGNALGFPGLTIEKEFPDTHREVYPGPDALDMDGNGSTEPLTFIGGGTTMSYHDPFYMGIENAAMIPPTEVWVDDDYFFGGDNDGHIWGLDAFAVIQNGIDIVAGSIVNVAEGTYTEDVTIDKDDLTLKGAQFGVDPRGGRASDESEIVGVVVVTSAATNVAFDGFKFTSPTRAFTPRGFNLRIESESSTVSNNIFVAEENAGHTYSGYLDFDSITNATVTQNSFSGHLDLIQTPNVVRLGITGAGIVTVADNEMRDVGGGGGIGIMCGNAAAVVNIDGNEIKNTGNECIWVANWLSPGYSTFATLSITSNDLSEATKNGIKFELPVVGTVLISGNEFRDNPVQVLDKAEVLDIQDVLDANNFDRAVVVNHEGASLLHTIWSFIQDGVDAAVAGDAVGVLPGTYPEDVTVSTADLTLGSVSMHDAVVEGTIVVNANGVTVGGFTITNFSQIPTPDWSAIYVPGGTDVVIANNSIDGSALDPVANLTVGIHTLYGGSADIVAHGNTIVNCRMGIYNQGAAMLIGSNTIENNAHCGIGVDTSLGTEIYENSIRYNAIGIEVFGEGVVAHFNNICGNTLYGIWSAGPVVDAQNNYWCDPSGPSHSPGYGDKVSGDVLYDPWLLEPFVPGAPLPTTFDKTLALNIGWTLVSTDNWIDAASVVGEGVVWALNYTPSLGWFEVDPAALVPVDALYLKMVAGGGLGFDYSGGVPVASSKDLEAGWNLISSATLTNAKAVLSPLRYVQVGNEQGVGLATLVSQGNFNQHSPSFYLATLGPGDWIGLGGTMLNPFDGYWVYMNAAKNFGVVPGAQPNP